MTTDLCGAVISPRPRFDHNQASGSAIICGSASTVSDAARPRASASARQSQLGISSSDIARPLLIANTGTVSRNRSGYGDCQVGSQDAAMLKCYHDGRSLTISARHAQQMDSDFKQRAARMAKAVQSIRMRSGKTTTEFGQMLGTNQSMVSRYEGGKCLPGYITTAKLLALAEGDDRQAIMERIEDLVGSSDAQKIIESIPDGANSVLLGETLWTGKPNLDRFYTYAKIIAHGKAEVDESLPLILELWIQWGNKYPEAARYFQDAARFLLVGFRSSPVFEDGPIPPQTVGSSTHDRIAPSFQAPDADVRHAPPAKHSRKKSA